LKVSKIIILLIIHNQLLVTMLVLYAKLITPSHIVYPVSILECPKYCPI